MTDPTYALPGNQGSIIPQNGSVGTPITPPSAPTQPPGATPSPLTIKDIYGSVPATDQGIDTSLGIYKGIADTPVDEQGIRDATMKRLQTEIDATNQVYGEKLRQAQITGENNLGSNAAIDARRGLIGSDFGNAQDQKVRGNNSAVYSGIDAEKAAAIAAITDKGNEAARQEIAAKTAAKQQGVQDYISFLGQSDARKTTRTNNAASHAVAAGVDLNAASPSDLKAIADSYQISPDALVSSYVSAKHAATTAKLAQETSQAELIKPTGVSLASDTYQFNPATGKNEKIASGTPQDSNIKEFQLATAQGYTGSLTDFLAQKANLKVSDSVTHDPISGALQVVQRSGPKVAGLPSGKAAPTTASSSSGPAIKVSPAAVNPATKAPTAPVVNPLDTLRGSDLAYAQTGLPQSAKFKYPGQIDGAAARIQKVIPGWTPATATASYNFFKSPGTQQFIANSNTVLNSINLLKTLSSKVSRGDFTIVNGRLTGLKAGISDPNAAKFLQAAQIAGDEGGKLLGSSGGSDFTTQLGLSLINTNYSDPTFQTTMDQFAGRVNNKVSEYYKQAGSAAGSQAPTNGAPVISNGVDLSQFHR